MGLTTWFKKRTQPQEAQDVESLLPHDEWEGVEKHVRHAFVRKVFGILLCQILFTAAVGSIFVVHRMRVLEYIDDNRWPIWVSVFGMFGTLLFIAFKPNLARTFPSNYVLLAVYTAFTSVFVGIVCTGFNPQVVAMAAGMTTAIVLALTIFALQTKYDFTTTGGLLLSLLLTLLMASVLAVFVPVGDRVHVLISGLGALLFSCYIVYDIQVLMSGKKVQISPDDYVLAALHLYLDIVNLFIRILRLLRGR